MLVTVVVSHPGGGQRLGATFSSDDSRVPKQGLQQSSQSCVCVCGGIRNVCKGRSSSSVGRWCTHV